MLDLGTITQIIVPALALGGAWGGAKAALNGTKHRVTKLEKVMDIHQRQFETHKVESIDRLARIETKLDIVVTEQIAVEKARQLRAKE